MSLKASKKAIVAFLALTALVSLYFFCPWVFDGGDWWRALLKKNEVCHKMGQIVLLVREGPKDSFTQTFREERERGNRESERERD